MGATWFLMQTVRFHLELDAINVGVLLVSVWVVGYLIVWAIVGYVLTTVAHLGSDSDSSIMTVMYPASQPPAADFEATQQFSMDHVRKAEPRK
jgi:hypothetical protein